MLNRFKSFIATRWIGYISDEDIKTEKQLREWDSVYEDLTKSLLTTFHNSMRDDDV